MVRSFRQYLADIFFGGRTKKNTSSSLVSVSGSYLPLQVGEAYSYPVVRAAVDAVARHAAKLNPRHIRRVGDETEIVFSAVGKMLSRQPNAYMDAYSFLYKVVSQLWMNGNAFIYIDRDKETDEIIAFYPVPASSVELLHDKKDDLYLRFRFLGATQLTVPYPSNRIIHLRRHYYKHDLFGAGQDALTQTLELLQASDEGMINAIKNSAQLRGILKFANMLKPDDIERERKRFVEQYLGLSNSGGVAAVDSRLDFQPVKQEIQVTGDSYQQLLKEKVYAYFGVSDEIVTGKFTEQQWDAFYSSVIEPLSLHMSLTFTEAVFSIREKGHGNEIIFDSERLQYSSTKTKLSFVALVDRGAMTPNEWRAALNLPPLPGGDEPIRRLDTAPAVPKEVMMDAAEGDQSSSDQTGP